MRFLVDAQLPPALARWLSAQGHEAEHVLDFGSLQSSDREIWARAVSTGATILTKDRDFLTLRSLDRSGAPVVWIRIGNTTRRALLAAFARVLPDIERALAAGETLVEVTE
jgi:predicted nuclease of predicted toxin-antitoxin system